MKTKTMKDLYILTTATYIYVLLLNPSSKDYVKTYAHIQTRNSNYYFR